MIISELIKKLEDFNAPDMTVVFQDREYGQTDIDTVQIEGPYYAEDKDRVVLS